MTAGADSTVKAGNGNDTVTAGADSSVTDGNGNDAVTAGAQSTITVGNGNDTITMGASDTATVGNGNDTFIFAGGLGLSAPSALTVNEDGSIAVPISIGQSADAFGNDVISGFSTSNDKLEFSTSQFANSTTVLADAKQVGSNTVISAGAQGSITLDNVNVTQLKSSDFIFTSGSIGTSGAVTVTISGIPSGVTFSDSAGPLTVTNGTLTLTTAQLAGLTLQAGEVTNATLTVTATDSLGDVVTQNIALTVNPVAPTLTSPTSLAVAEDGSVALGITETPFDSRDTVSITISGVPSDATLSAGTKNSNGTWTLTPAQLSGLSLKAGEVTAANLTITATNTQGATASTSKSIALTVNPVSPTLTAPTSLAVAEDGTVALGITETPFDSRDIVSITISGVPGDATLSAGTKNSNGTWTLTPAQLSGLSLKAGEVTAANLTITATNTQGATAATTKSIALTVNPVSPTLTAPTSLAVSEDGTVALGITETPFDSRDTVSITISGVPSDAALSAGTKNSNGTWTLTPAQLSGLSLKAGEVTTANLTITATNTEGTTARLRQERRASP